MNKKIFGLFHVYKACNNIKKAPKKYINFRLAYDRLYYHDAKTAKDDSIEKDLEIVLPNYLEAGQVEWAKAVGAGANVQYGQNICNIVHLGIKRSIIYSPVQGHIMDIILGENSVVHKNSVICKIRVDKDHYDADPFIVTLLVKQEEFIEGKIVLNLGTGNLIEKDQVLCTLTYTIGEDEYMEEFRSPFNGLVAEINCRENRKAINFDNLFTIIPFSLKDAERKGQIEFDLLLRTHQFRVIKAQNLKFRNELIGKWTIVWLTLDLNNVLNYMEYLFPSGDYDRDLALTAFYVKSIAYALRHHRMLAGRMEKYERSVPRVIDIAVGFMYGMQMIFPALEAVEYMDYMTIYNNLIEFKKLIEQNSLQSLVFKPHIFAVHGDLNLGSCSIIPGFIHNRSGTITISSIYIGLIIHKRKLRLRPLANVVLTVDQLVSEENIEPVVFMSKIKNAFSDPILTLF